MSECMVRIKAGTNFFNEIKLKRKITVHSLPLFRANVASCSPFQFCEVEVCVD